MTGQPTIEQQIEIHQLMASYEMVDLLQRAADSVEQPARHGQR